METQASDAEELELLRGTCALLGASPEQARALIQDSFRDLPESAALRYGLAVLLERAGRRTEALTALREAVSRRSGMLEEVASELLGLDRLLLHDIGLESVPDAVGIFAHLRTLDLGHNRIAVLPNSIASLRELQILYVHDNRLTRLPDAIGELTALTYLNASENPLEELPLAIGQLTKLVELRLLHAGLDVLPEAIGGLAALRELHLRGNRLTVLPDAIGKLPELRHLDLRENRLTGLPKG